MTFFFILPYYNFLMWYSRSVHALRHHPRVLTTTWLLPTRTVAKTNTFPSSIAWRQQLIQITLPWNFTQSLSPYTRFKPWTSSCSCRDILSLQAIALRAPSNYSFLLSFPCSRLRCFRKPNVHCLHSFGLLLCTWLSLFAPCWILSPNPVFQTLLALSCLFLHVDLPVFWHVS